MDRIFRSTFWSVLRRAIGLCNEKDYDHFPFVKIIEIFASLKVWPNKSCKNDWLNMSSSDKILYSPSRLGAFPFCSFSIQYILPGLLRWDCCSVDIVTEIFPEMTWLFRCINPAVVYTLKVSFMSLLSYMCLPWALQMATIDCDCS